MEELKGTGVAIVTPFTSDFKVDYQSLDKLINYQIERGIDYLVVMGTTGESVTLSKEEKQDIVAFAKDVVKERVPLVLGIGGNNTQAVCDEISSSNLSGISAILSVSPYYNKPTQEGIYQHYKAVSEVSPLPIILYNVPSRTSSNIQATTTLRLANDFDNIVAVKEASGDMGQIMEIIHNRPKGFLVLSGDDALTLAMVAMGGDGVISVIANAYPAEFSSMVKAALMGDLATAREKHYHLTTMIDLIFRDGNPAGIKCVLNQLQLTPIHVRLPLVQIGTAVEQAILKEVEHLSLIKV